MKANELRIGNLVLMAFENVVETVTARMIGFINLSDERGNKHPFEPIPLTEEWLKRFGFNWNDRMGEFKHIYQSIYVILIDGDISLFFHNQPIKHIQYVHQLQNLFYCLTGEELTMN